MDEVGRLLKSLPVLLAAAAAMGIFTLCGNAVLRFSSEEDEDKDEDEYENTGNAAKSSARDGRIRRLRERSDVIIQTNLAARSLITLILSAAGYEYLFEPLHGYFGRVLDGAAAEAVFWLTIILTACLSAAVVAAVGINFPKRLCTSGRVGDGFARRSFSLYRTLILILSPLRILVAAISGGLLRLFGVKREDEQEQVTGEEIIKLIDSADEIEDHEAEMISNILEFSDMELHEVMTHRTELSAVEYSSPVSEAVEISVETGVSRIPVYKKTVDDICGVLYIKDLLPLILDPEKRSAPVSDYLHEVKFAPESGSCMELFRYFTENKKQIAIVLDEYGGTAGVVTMEDLLECIVGSISDEYDEAEDIEFDEITPNTFDILGSADPEDVMERLGVEIEEERDYDTMGGFITHLLGYIPADGETPAVRYKDITFAVIKASDNRIEKIRAVKDRKKSVVADEE